MTEDGQGVLLSGKPIDQALTRWVFVLVVEKITVAEQALRQVPRGLRLGQAGRDARNIAGAYLYDRTPGSNRDPPPHRVTLTLSPPWRVASLTGFGQWDEMCRLPIAREPAKYADFGSSPIGWWPVDARSAVAYISNSSIENPGAILMFPRISSSFPFPLGLLLLALSVSPLSAAEELKRVVERGSLERVEAVVEALNVDNRIVTLRSLSEDETVVMEVGDDVRNLAQVKVGDRVVVEFYQAVAVDLKKGGGLEETADQAVIAARAKPGDKPAGGVGEATEVVATILAIDRDKPSVTLKGPQGNVVDVIVRDPSKLVGVDVGDQVIITYSRAMAISVEPSPIQ